MNGLGTYLWSDTGSFYHGYWKRGKRHGWGVFVFGVNTERSGDILDGHWMKDKFLIVSKKSNARSESVTRNFKNLLLKILQKNRKLKSIVVENVVPIL